MCGIAGLINCGNAHVLEKMCEIIRHRGPDDGGLEWFDDKKSGLGHRRLSIIDLSTAGHQPMTNDHGNLWITYNGEIYNYTDIRDELKKSGYEFRSGSDTEVLLKAYEFWDVECLTRFNGMFAFAIYDNDSGTLFAARDRVGIKPFYYYHDGKSFIFASEIKSILESNLIEKMPDYDALMTPTRFQLSPYTGFKNIFKLPPGHYLVFKNGKVETKSYWNINCTEDGTLSEKSAMEKLDLLLNDSARLNMVSDVPVGIFLSGGLDSSLLAALMSRNIQQKMHSFTIKFSTEDQKYEKMVDDYKYARVIAKQFNFEHREIEIQPDVANLLPKIIWHLDEPLADAAAINTYLIAQAARDQGIIVMINGMGGDEIYGGYRKQLACLNSEYYQKFVPEFIRKMMYDVSHKIPVATSKQGFKYLRWLKRFLSFSSLDPVHRFLSSDMSLTENQFDKLFGEKIKYDDTYFFKAQYPNFSDENISYLTQMCLNDTKVFLPEHNLTYSDKACMMSGVEARPALTDHRLIEFMFQLPPKFRIKGLTQKYLLKKVSEPYLPRNIIHREKGGFAAPLRAWIRGPLSEMVNDLLSEQALNKRGFYNAEYIQQLIKADKSGREDNSYLIWWILNNELWFRTFFS